MNNDNYIVMLNYKNLVDLISEAKERIIICLPGIHNEVGHALIEAASAKIDIKVIIDLSEECIRNGFGDIESVYALKEHGIALYEFPNNIVSFLICDQVGYFLFPQSRIFASDDVGTNAVEMDPLTTAKVIAYFFPPKGKGESLALEQTVSRAIKYIQDNSLNIINNALPSPIQSVNTNKMDEIKRRLDQNLPLHPDLQRQMKIYTAKIQFVEFHFEGKNIQSAKISIPAEALPFKDDTIRQRLEARMKLFEGIEEHENYRPLKEVKEEIESLRKKYLTPIGSRDKSIIHIEEKEEFNKKVEQLQSKLDETRQQIVIWLAEEILNSGDRLKNELKNFFKEYPPKEYIQYQSQKSLFERKTESLATQIVARIKIPEPSELLAKMEIRINFYDLTWDDFRNQQFLDELVEKEVFDKGAMEQIIKMKDVYAVKKNEKKR